MPLEISCGKCGFIFLSTFHLSLHMNPRKVLRDTNWMIIGSKECECPKCHTILDPEKFEVVVELLVKE